MKEVHEKKVFQHLPTISALNEIRKQVDEIAYDVFLVANRSNLIVQEVQDLGYHCFVTNKTIPYGRFVFDTSYPTKHGIYADVKQMSEGKLKFEIEHRKTREQKEYYYIFQDQSKLNSRGTIIAYLQDLYYLSLLKLQLDLKKQLELENRLILNLNKEQEIKYQSFVNQLENGK